MRLWSLHPKYLDQQGLCGLWREAIMARNALEQGEDHGYFQHPQLERFKDDVGLEGLLLIDSYLHEVYKESQRRNYNFDADNYEVYDYTERIPVTNGQLEYEENHLRNKLDERDSIEKHDEITIGQRFLDVHPLFFVINGEVAPWEKDESVS